MKFLPGLIQNFLANFPKTATKGQVYFLLLINFVIWIIIGVSAAPVVAFFVFFFTPDGPNRVVPALISGAIVLAGCVLFGLYMALMPLFKR